MSLLKTVVKQSTGVNRIDEGNDSDIRAIRDGSLVTCDWIEALVLEGRVFHAYVGNASTEATLDASWTNTDPDIMIDVPDGTSIIPLNVTTILQEYGTTELFETMCLCSKTLGAATSTLFSAINMNTRSGNGSNCVVCTAPTVTSGYTTGYFELYRTCIQKIATIGTGDDDTQYAPHRNRFEWSWSDWGFAPVLQGEASLQVWATCSTPKGYIHVVWAELPTSSLK